MRLRTSSASIAAAGLAVLFATTGCQTYTQTGALTGGMIGAGTGALISDAAGHSGGTGALIGAGIGILSGALIGSGLDQVHANRPAYAAPAPVYVQTAPAWAVPVHVMQGPPGGPMPPPGCGYWAWNGAGWVWVQR